MMWPRRLWDGTELAATNIQPSGAANSFAVEKIEENIRRYLWTGAVEGDPGAGGFYVGRFCCSRSGAADIVSDDWTLITHAGRFHPHAEAAHLRSG